MKAALSYTECVITNSNRKNVSELRLSVACSAVLSILTVIKWIQNRSCCNGVQYAVHNLERAYCVWCNNRP